jgi:hypothetical protein
MFAGTRCTRSKSPSELRSATLQDNLIVPVRRQEAECIEWQVKVPIT